MLRFQYRVRSGWTGRIGMQTGRFDDEHSGHFEEGLWEPEYRGMGGRREIPAIFRDKTIREIAHIFRFLYRRLDSFLYQFKLNQIPYRIFPKLR